MIAERDVVRDLASMAVKRGEQRLIVSSTVVTLEPGQLLTSQRELARRWGWSHKRVRTVLTVLERAGIIHIDVLGSFSRAPATRITIASSPRSGHTRAPDGTRGHTKARGHRVAQTEFALPAASRAEPLGPPHPPCSSEISSKTAVHPGGDRGPGKEGAREQRTVATTSTSTATVPHERYAAELAQVLNDAQLANPLIDPDAFSPITLEQRSVREAALAMLNAGVPLEYAKRAAWLEGQRYKPSARHPQIRSIAFLQKGVTRDWLRSRATRDVQEERRCPRTRGFQAIADVLASVTPTPKRS